MSSTVDRRAFVALSSHCEVIMQGFIPIHIRRRDETGLSAQQPDISSDMTKGTALSQASYMAITTVSGMLYGSI